MKSLYMFTNEIKQLKQLKLFLKQGDTPNALHLSKKLFQVIKEKPLHFTVRARQSKSNQERSHLPVYKALATRNKNLALSDIQEIERELIGKDTSITRCIVLIDTLINTRFYSADSKVKIDSWKPLVHKSLFTKTIII